MLEAVALPVLAVRLRRTQAERYAGLRSLARTELAKKLILIVIDGLTPSMLEDTLERGDRSVARRCSPSTAATAARSRPSPR